MSLARAIRFLALSRFCVGYEALKYLSPVIKSSVYLEASSKVMTRQLSAREEISAGVRTSFVLERKPLAKALKISRSMQILSNSRLAEPMLFAAERTASPKSWPVKPGMTVSKSITHKALLVFLSNRTLFIFVSLWVTRIGILPSL